MNSLTWAILAILATDGGSVDGGTASNFNAPLYAQCPTAEEKVEAVDGGYLFPVKRAQRIACLVETCEADRSQREKEAAVDTSTPSWAFWLSAVVGAAVLGFSAGVAITKK